MNRFKFGSLKYYPTKLVPPNNWKGNYMPIFKQRMLNSEEIQNENKKRIIFALPTMIYLGYWVFLGSFNVIHIAGFCAIYGFYIRHRSNLKITESLTIQEIYLSNKGDEWIVISNSNINKYSKITQDNKDINQEEIRNVLQIKENQEFLKFKSDDVKMDDKFKIQDRFKLFAAYTQDAEINEDNPDNFCIQINGKAYFLDISMNQYTNMEEYLKAMLENKQIVLN